MNSAQLFLVGVTHRTAPLGFREKLSLGAEREAGLAAELKRLPALSEFVILNTCNRVEIYGVGDPHASPQVVAAFCARQGAAPADLQRHGFVVRGRGAVDHLLRVASGLDSQILGETEIFGQVKRAYAVAQDRGTAGPILNRLFQKTFQAGKHVRTNTGVSTGQVSVANVAVDLAQTIFGDLGAAGILIIGAGEMGEKSARAFQSRGVKRTRVASRNREHAESLARTVAGETVRFEDRESRIAEADIVVSSTSAPGTVISFAAVRGAMASRPSRPLLVIDLAMPRDVDTAIAGLANVHLYNLDDLAQVAARNRQARMAEAEAGRLALEPRAAALWGALQIQLATLVAGDAGSGSSPVGADPCGVQA